MTRQAQVGAFAITALLLLFGVFYVITDFATRHTGYRIGVHFRSAAGVTPGAQVYFSGVDIGSVESIQLLPDNTVDMILAVSRDIDIPAASRFLIQAPLTGSPDVVIVPPHAPPPLPLLPREVLPVAEQPQGINGTSIWGASFRGIYDLADLDASLFIVAPGQSGNVFRGHARDMLTRWRDGAVIRLEPISGPGKENARLLP